MTPIETIAQTIRRRREQIGMTQTRAAELAGLQRPNWTRAETGTPATMATYEAMAAAVGLEFRGQLLRRVPGWTPPAS